MPAMPETTSPKKTAFFDFDGTLVAPVFGAGGKKTPGFPLEDWKARLAENPDAYGNSAVVVPVLSYAMRLRACGWDLKILTGAGKDGSADAKKRYIAEQKIDWIFPEIIPVASGRDKTAYILSYAAGQGLTPSDCLLLDDDYPVIVQAAAAGIQALHISHVVAENYDPSGTDPRLHKTE